MTQPGETDGYTVYDHVDALLRHWPDALIDYVIVNTGTISDTVGEKYKMEGAEVIKLMHEDREKLKAKGIKLITEDLIDIKKDYVGMMRLNYRKLLSI